MTEEKPKYIKSSIHFKERDFLLRDKVLLLCKERCINFNTAVLQALKDWVNK